MYKFLTMALILSASQLQATESYEFSYEEHVDMRLKQAEKELENLGFELTYESELREYSDLQKHLYYSGQINALQDIKDQKRHAQWVKDNNLRWNGYRWVPAPRYGD